MRRDPGSETSAIVRPLIDVLNCIPGVLAMRLHSGQVKVRRGWVFLGETGQADVVVIVRGLAVLFEVKKAKGLVSEEQLAWHARARRAGAMVFVVRTVAAAVEEVRKLLVIQDEKQGAA